MADAELTIDELTPASTVGDLDTFPIWQGGVTKKATRALVVAGLATGAELDAKADLVHTHAISDVIDLETELDGKAPLVHTHAISDVTDLDVALAGKADLEHMHEAADVTDFDAAVDARISLAGAQPASDELAGIAALTTLGFVRRTADGVYTAAALVPADIPPLTLAKISDAGALAGKSTIVDADVAAGAAIALAKLAPLAFNFALISSGSGMVAVSAVTAVELGRVAGVTSPIQTQLTALAADIDAVEATAGAAAVRALSNLAAVAINASLTPGAAGALDLGAAASAWRDVYVAGSSASPAANRFKLTGLATAARTVTFADADSNTVVPSSAGANQFATGVSAAGAISYAQPAFSNLSGSIAVGQLPATVVQTGQSNTYTTGAQDFATAGSLKVPIAAGANPNVNGRVAYDSTANKFKGGVSSAAVAFCMESRQVLTSTGLTGGGALSGDLTLLVVADSTVQKSRISLAGSLVGSRQEINFIQGANAVLTVTDNAGSNRVDVTIAATGGGGSVATDSIWDAAGDLAVGTGPDTAARLPKGLPLQVMRVNAAGTGLEYATPTGGAGGSGQRLGFFRAQDGVQPVTSFATFDTRLGASTPGEVYPVVDFDATVPEYIDFPFTLPTAYAGGGLTVTPYFTMTSAVAGSVVLGVAIRRLTLDTEDADLSQTYVFKDSASTPVSATNGAHTTAPIALSSGAEMDNAAAGDPIIIRVRRTAPDGAAGDLEIWFVAVRET